MKTRTFSTSQFHSSSARLVILALLGVAPFIVGIAFFQLSVRIILLGGIASSVAICISRMLQWRRHYRYAARLTALSEGQLAALAARAQRVTIPARTVLFRQNAPADSLYLVVRGEVELLRRDSDGIYAPFVALGAGSLLGEAGLLGRTTRSVAAKAITEVELLALDREVVAAVLDSASPDSVEIVTLLPMALANDIPARMRLLNTSLTTINRNAALWLLGSPLVHLPYDATVDAAPAITSLA